MRRRELGEALRQGIISAAKVLLEQKAAIEPTELEAHMGNVRKAVTRLQPEALAAKALRSSGTIGGRRYAAGQWLSVRCSEVWHDAVVVSVAGDKHQLRTEDGEVLEEGASPPSPHPS